MLAGGERDFDLAVPAVVRRIRSFTVEADLPGRR